MITRRKLWATGVAVLGGTIGVTSYKMKKYATLATDIAKTTAPVRWAESTKLAMTGQITFDPAVESFAGDAPNVMLVGKIAIKDGHVIFALLSDYHILHGKRLDNGHETVCLISRSVEERDKYSSWPPRVAFP